MNFIFFKKLSNILIIEKNKKTKYKNIILRKTNSLFFNNSLP